MIALVGIVLTALLCAAMPTKAMAAEMPESTALPNTADAQPEATEQLLPAETEQTPEEAAVPDVQQEPEPVEIVTTPSLVVANAEVMDIPSLDGNVVGSLVSGQTVNVYTVNVNNEWDAITAADGTMQYVHGSAVALTAPPYSYEYMSDLTRITGFTGAQLEKALQGTGLAGLGNYYAEKERTHGINALFLIGIAKLESAGGTSSLARNSNNLGGLKNGNSGYLSFATKEDCVEYMADLLKEKYLTEGGRYYKGKTSKDVSIRYCEQSASWYGQVESLMKDSYERIAA